MSEADDAVLAEIIELAKRQTGAKTVTATTRLYSDLGMTGDDAQEFLTAFAVKYDVDMSSLVWLRYFDDESTMADMLEPAMALAASILNPSFAVRWQSAHDAEREITIGHLVDIAREKVWREPHESARLPRKSLALGLIFSAFALLILGFFVLLGVVVIYAFLTGQLGEQKILALVGVAAMSIVLPVSLAFASWRQISAKLASAPSVGAS